MFWHCKYTFSFYHIFKRIKDQNWKIYIYDQNLRLAFNQRIHHCQTRKNTFSYKKEIFGFVLSRTLIGKNKEKSQFAKTPTCFLFFFFLVLILFCTVVLFLFIHVFIYFIAAVPRVASDYQHTTMLPVQGPAPVLIRCAQMCLEYKTINSEISDVMICKAHAHQPETWFTTSERRIIYRKILYLIMRYRAEPPV